ncbi:PaaX family transcriptional regulator C-terminal domain-containing protein [Modestobacter sp. NPDC049651]|uniref:PaaX family transcriptional regulator n=1 Tax=unclassified Modestobacter TaxID=2643866 RepID=UPI0033CEF42F
MTAGPDLEQAPAGHASAGHRPQALLLSFLGGLVEGRDLPPVPAAVLLRLLGSLGVAEAAARATLSRMSRKGLLARTPTGRTVAYTLTPAAETLLAKAGARVNAGTPFDHPGGEWTLLSYSMPESRRDLRHQLRAALTWAGFGGVRDGLWIAPGTVDVAAVFADAGLTEVAGLAEWFLAAPLPGVDMAALVHRAWPVDRIREQHEAFIRRWAAGPGEADALSQMTLLGADWLQVLRADPGLPAAHLPADWPATRSTAAYQRCAAALLPAARRQLDAELG